MNEITKFETPRDVAAHVTSAAPENGPAVAAGFALLAVERPLGFSKTNHLVAGPGGLAVAVIDANGGIDDDPHATLVRKTDGTYARLEGFRAFGQNGTYVCSDWFVRPVEGESAMETRVKAGENTLPHLVSSDGRILGRTEDGAAFILAPNGARTDLGDGGEEYGYYALGIDATPDFSTVVLLREDELAVVRNGEETAHELPRGFSGLDAKVSADGKTAFVLSRKGPVWSFDLADGQKRAHFEKLPLPSGLKDAQRFEEYESLGLAVSPDGLSCATVSTDGKVRFRDLRTGEEKIVLSVPQGVEHWKEASTLNTICFTDDATLLVGNDLGQVMKIGRDSSVPRLETAEKVSGLLGGK